MAKLRVVFMGTPEFSVPALEALCHEHDVVAVYSQPDRPAGRGQTLQPPPVKKRALELGISVFQPVKLTVPGEFERLEGLKPDVIVVVAYGQLLKKNVLELPRLGCINIHSSLLPRWRGAAPIQWAILEGDAESGISTMYMVEKLDAGDVLLQAKTPILMTDTAGSLHDRLSEMGSALILETIQGLASGTLRGRVQDETQVTYASKLSKEMEALDTNLNAQVLDRRVRALNPWPGCSVWVGESRERLKVKQAKLRADIQGPSGKIFERAGMILLGTAQGALELLSLQWDGKKEVDPAAFLNGLRGRGKSLPLDISSSPT